eukprot:CAMPEP_0183433652 /NCGR_PEP_ID=MMETSP0370-20130417/61524_1 /TAXON_ID=268820 /ORGANISM="Peridinium aciculiferum, Strain PAER-2" /LENGTH=285 /DNA_ID=CAMNT_0025620045 /DNA_START=47 /DNA_END=904 /DNA_ORIENTATION=-
MAALWTSKLGTKYPMEEIQRLDHEHHQILERLRKEPRNSRCAECGEHGTLWASVNLGIFVCVRCADVHRAMGTHISKVKGCSGTYLWGEDELQNMRQMGNANAESKYGAAKPASEASKDERVLLARRKYESLAYTGSAAAQQQQQQQQQQRHRQQQQQSEGEGFAPSTACVAKVSVAKLAVQATAWSPPQASAPRPKARAAALDVLDWDTLFADDSMHAGSVTTKPAAASSKLADSSMDDFLGMCLPSPQPAMPTVVHQPQVLVPAVGHLATSNDHTLWSDFGAW